MTTLEKTLLFAGTMGAASLSSIVTTRLVLGTPAQAQPVPQVGVSPIDIHEPPLHETIFTPSASTLAIRSLAKYITVDSAGNLTIKANSIALQAAQNVNVSAQIGATIQSAANLKLTSAGQTTIRGAIVSLN